MKGFAEILKKIIYANMNNPDKHQLEQGTVYIQDYADKELSKLYTLDLTTGKATLVGKITTKVSDIAFVGSELYGLDETDSGTQLIKIDLNTGDAAVVGNIGFAATGLAYKRTSHTLYATTAKKLIAINLQTGKGTEAATVANQDYNCGEVAFAADGKAYITLIGYDKKKLLASCNLDTGKVQTIGDIGFAGLSSMEFVGDVLYGVTGNFFHLDKNGQLIRINTTTGQGTLVTLTNPISRWAGIAIYQPATVIKEENTDEMTSKEDSPESTFIKQEETSFVTINIKNNCYVIDPEQMKHLQQNVAKSFSLGQGFFDVKITSGSYSYADSKIEREPFVLLWIYGSDGSKFINKNTDFETAATWTTLYGYNDSLKLEVKANAVLCALFFDFNTTDNSGSINLSITSSKPYFQPQELTVDSKKNCYILDEKYLQSLKQSGNNFIEINPGNYRIKIHESNASYWLNNKKFQIEPKTLIWIKGGKFLTKLTGIEVKESWFSLNGIKDEVVLKVKQKTTLSGFFFDTHNESNEGQIILAIEPVSATEFVSNNQNQENNQMTDHKQENTITTETVTNIESTTVNAGTAGMNSSIEFTFRFSEAEFKKKWEEQWQQINASITVIDEGDAALEAKYWDQLEHWLLKSYEKHFKNLAIEVAKVRFTMDAYIQQMEFSINQHLQGWSGYLDNKLNVEISNKINQHIKQHIDQIFEQKIRNNIEIITNNIVNKHEFNQYIDRSVNQHISQSFEQNIRNNIKLITENIINNNTELNQYVSQEINKNIQLITHNIVNDNDVLNQYIDKRLEQNVVNNNVVINQIFDNQETTQKIENIFIDNSKIRQRIENIFIDIDNSKINQKIENIVVNSPEINNRILNFVINSTEINQKIENIHRNVDIKIENLRNEWNQTFISLVTQYVDEIINIIGGKETFNLLIANVINIKVDEILSQIVKIKHELTVIMSNSDRHLYEWTLGELMVIKGCLTDRQALVEQLVSFSAELRTKLDCTPCVDIKTFKPFKPTALEANGK